MLMELLKHSSHCPYHHSCYEKVNCYHTINVLEQTSPVTVCGRNESTKPTQVSWL